MSLFKVFDIAGSGMAAQSLRLNTVASNLANANSVASSAQGAYRAREPLFAAVQQSVSGQQNSGATGVRVMGLSESQAPIPSHYAPNNPLADANGYVYDSNVNPVDELVNMISASRSYQSNVEVMNTTKQLLVKTLDLGK
ncbi:MAG: flagellar basal body rod protein FlgC [Rhodanobacter sp.]|nr:MAG: flagellar basal body rod protein FlgC [Rhodanobacter sp.]